MHRPQLVLLESPEQLPEAASQRLAAAITEVVHRKGSCSLMLAGGNTPRGVYAALARMEQLPWGALRVYFGDERCVPPDHEDSNYLMARQSLLEPAGLAPEQVFRMRGEDEDRDAAAADYAAQLPESVDIVLLGMGPDGHTASLFPGDEVLGEAQRLVAPVYGTKPPPWRLTVTPPVLQRAGLCMVFALGASKADKIKEVFLEPVDIQARPIQLALDGLWFVDEAAAAQLPASLQAQAGA